MGDIKTKSIRNIEEKMGNVDSETIRYQVLQHAKSFKTSWIDLGQTLYTVWKDKIYKNWGYSKFDLYTSKEIGIRKQTALKLLRSYYFLEKEEPNYVNKEHVEGSNAASLPTYESVDVLRLASKKKDIDRTDYMAIKKDILEKGKDAREVKRDLTALIRQREELEPEEAWKKKKVTAIKRLISLLKSVKEEIKISKLLPAQTLKEADHLIDKLESELSGKL
ncbi:MAG: hypothetical protein COS99_08895 [Candidatus Omnitrophica bacterium CG07_land_8_20_14_0_80_42_15]|uniref:Uncharacterized protein n=1 Tax=Candidatus Aquitaenariimonas noxiae TaxID=1974741 RepID=A0A2J0KSK8_9BACT|nr:MAG: hypothetical protein COS99_08895 [Candidatus Omnitrophica bacterium CG07_land_8_20_14_0_80_42_15]